MSEQIHPPMGNGEIIPDSTPTPPRRVGANLWQHQLNGIISVELRKLLFNTRAMPLLLLACLPVAAIGLMAMVNAQAILESRDESVSFGMIYEPLILSVQAFFGSAFVFMNLVRGDISQRSLHYYFLVPVRRELLILGKYLSGFCVTALLFGLSTLVTLVLFDFAFNNNGPQTVSGSRYIAYPLITILACMGYGAVFFLLGFWLKSTIIPIAAVFAWETIQFAMPPALKLFTATFHISGLVPEPFNHGPFAVLAARPDPMFSIAGLLTLCTILVGVAMWKARRMEIRYAE